MKKEVLKEPIFAEKILRIIRSSPSMEEMREQLRDYHDNDIAQSLKYLNRAERNLLYSALDAEWLAEIISYIDDPVEYVDEIGIDKLSAIINEMDADDAVDLWENIDESVNVGDDLGQPFRVQRAVQQVALGTVQIFQTLRDVVVVIIPQLLPHFLHGGRGADDPEDLFCEDRFL